MEFTILRENLLKQLQIAANIVERKQTLAILGNVLIKASNNQLSLIATDLEIQLSAKINLHTDAKTCGEITAPAKKLLDIFKTLTDDTEIKIYQKDNRLCVQSTSSRYTLNTLPANEFPSIENDMETQTIVMPFHQLKSLMESTYFAMAQHDVRYILNGLLLEFDGTTVKAIATDGHRLAISQQQYNSPVPNKLQVVVPRKAISEILKLTDNLDEEVKMSLSTSHLTVATTTFTLTTKLIDGKYPDYQRVIPKQGNFQAVVSRETLKQCVTRAAILANEKFRGVSLSFKPKQLTLTANNAEQERAEESMPIQYNGDEITISFNANYLLDVLNSLPSEKVKLTLVDATTSMLIEDEKLDGNLYLIMPMRL